MREKLSLDEAFKLLPDRVHIGICFDWICQEWFVEIDQTPFGKLTYHDPTGSKILPEIIKAACEKWEGRNG